MISIATPPSIRVTSSQRPIAYGYNSNGIHHWQSHVSPPSEHSDPPSPAASDWSSLSAGPTVARASGTWVYDVLEVRDYEMLTDSPPSSCRSIAPEDANNISYEEECFRDGILDPHVSPEDTRRTLAKARATYARLQEEFAAKEIARKAEAERKQETARQAEANKIKHRDSLAVLEREADYEFFKVKRNARARMLKDKARAIKARGGRTPSKAPAPERQRELLRSIYDEVTPYPDEGWIAQLAIHFNCPYDQIKNWFSNQRQKDSAEFRISHPGCEYDLGASLRKISIHEEGRERRMRPSAVACVDESSWTDDFFGDVLLVSDVRITMKERKKMAEKKAEEDAVAALLQLHVSA